MFCWTRYTSRCKKYIEGLLHFLCGCLRQLVLDLLDKMKNFPLFKLHHIRFLLNHHLKSIGIKLLTLVMVACFVAALSMVLQNQDKHVCTYLMLHDTVKKIFKTCQSCVKIIYLQIWILIFSDSQIYLTFSTKKSYLMKESYL